ncbi:MULTISPECIES: cytochrome c-type biogenesis protein [unclassified Halomonas]|uniref:cytochrome c-type biogenesis protein n=1 Tax=unclassified Halomonas TaxID=2609666 RepID=UPI0004E32F2C|nr:MULTISPECIES: cytochrome c-type biogenesis protein [unclassified Halomonas]KFC51538.1 cytochrome C [Halomonas sp. SUBG004]MCG7589225.1 cytochrome c-type biogenesis protein CcmH [Halomonas sp. McD50-5]MCG7615386.1 cytochrome c-type biogenesis protein CcmH [Halomonas sp. McD50-4]TNH19730.1 cytochrome c-type biogenesis protein CcmH [Halomonas sp. BL6]BCB61215.1 cytochrome c biogenesis protein [Halomonas sp. A020]
MALMRWVFAVMLLVLSSSVVAAGIEIREFDDPVMEQRYRDLTSSMRCPLCENQAIDDSDAPISGDMRERVYQLLQDGQSDIEIINHMVQRFGEYILYNPRLENRTYLLWGLPIGLFVLGTLVVVLMVRARRNASAKALSAEERARLDALINRERSS